MQPNLQHPRPAQPPEGTDPTAGALRGLGSKGARTPAGRRILQSLQQLREEIKEG